MDSMESMDMLYLHEYLEYCNHWNQTSDDKGSKSCFTDFTA